jgi:hypothetical protein
MKKESWLSPSFKIPSAGTARSLLFSGKKWQIHSDSLSNLILLASPELMGSWTEKELINVKDVEVLDLSVETNNYKYIISPKNEILSPLSKGDIPLKREWAQSVAQAFRATRRLESQKSLAGGIFSSHLKIILPTSEKSRDEKGDDIVFGTFLAGGQPISTRNFQSLVRATSSYVQPKHLSYIIKMAGISEPPNIRPGQSPLAGPPRPGRRRDEEPIAIRPMERPSDDSSKRKKMGDYFSLPGRKRLESFFNEQIVDILKNPKKYKKFGIGFPAATILHGPPGSGKTFAVGKLVEFIGWPVNHINSSSVASPYIHDTSKKISQTFDKAIRSAPSILVIDEMEAYMSNRTAINSHQHIVEEVGEFLRRIPEALEKKVLIIGMTNMITHIDPAILRQGRFDHKIKIDLPDAEEVRDLLNFLMKNVPHSEDFDLEPAVKALIRKPLSDAAFVLREASRLAARADKEVLDNECLKEAIKNLPTPPNENPPIGFMKN